MGGAVVESTAVGPTSPVSLCCIRLGGGESSVSVCSCDDFESWTVVGSTSSAMAVSPPCFPSGVPEVADLIGELSFVVDMSMGGSVCVVVVVRGVVPIVSLHSMIIGRILAYRDGVWVRLGSLVLGSTSVGSVTTGGGAVIVVGGAKSSCAYVSVTYIWCESDWTAYFVLTVGGGVT